MDPVGPASPAGATTAADRTADLVTTLNNRNVVDTRDGLTRRYQVVQTLEELLGRWSDGLTPVSTSAQVGRAGAAATDAGHVTGSTEANTNTAAGNDTARKARPVIICFGSYRLGVHNPTADIDALALCPPHCTRSDFFGSLVALLEKDEHATDLHPVPG